MSNTSLCFDPDLDNLTFNEDNSATLTVFNESSQTIVCEIQATPKNCYKINQSHFFLLPNIKIAIIIDFNNNADNDDRSDDVISIQWLPINENDITENAEIYWKQTSKTRRKEIIIRMFGCEFKGQNSLTVFDRAIIPVENQISVKVDLDRNIEKLGQMAIDSHTTVTELNFEFNALIQTMEATNAQQLSDIIKVLREIAKEYNQLENETRSAIRQTEKILSEVIRAVSSKRLKTSQKINLMKGDFSTLADEFDGLVERHGNISQQLAMQAEKAEAAKEENDRHVQKAEELKMHAQVCGILGTPGVGLISSVTACTRSAADSVDKPILKALAAVGGVLGGIVVGTVATVGSPILLTIAAALAIKSRAWSGTFESMHEMIRNIENIIKMAAQYLTDIRSDLNRLSHETSLVEQNKDNAALDHLFGRVKRSCENVMESCNKYVEMADTNKKNMKQIKKSSSK